MRTEVLGLRGWSPLPIILGHVRQVNRHQDVAMAGQEVTNVRSCPLVLHERDMAEVYQHLHTGLLHEARIYYPLIPTS